MAQSHSPPSETFDIAVVGGGVVGCAMARRFTLEGARVVLLEKAVDVLAGASKGNSAILHTGFDAPPGSLEQRCIAEGHAEFLEIRDALKLPLLQSGAIVAAWTPEEQDKLESLMEQAHANGIEDVQPLTAAAILAEEPNLASRVKGGFRVPREALIDPWSTPHAYLLQALTNGAAVWRGCEVTDGMFDGAEWVLETTQGSLRASSVINCAGLYGDILDQRLLGETFYSIRPRKGQFLVFDKAAARLVSSIVLPVPTEKTKGIVVCRTIYGNVLVGPTAEDQESRTDSSTDRDTLVQLHRKGAEILPALAEVPVTAAYAGLRPASEQKDYRIHERPERNYISVGGIRSTGLSSALGVARHVFERHRGFGHRFAALERPLQAPACGGLSEYDPRNWQEAANGGIVCHCELVTRREIEQVLSGPLPPHSLAGLKRRTRVTMGRCQGFYCMGTLARMTEGAFDVPLASVVDEPG
ncbi:NAD(P)/FAD-dependent oxidoreductase, partial [Fodinicurvata halophila]